MAGPPASYLCCTYGTPEIITPTTWVLSGIAEAIRYADDGDHAAPHHRRLRVSPGRPSAARQTLRYNAPTGKTYQPAMSFYNANTGPTAVVAIGVSTSMRQCVNGHCGLTNSSVVACDL